MGCVKPHATMLAGSVLCAISLIFQLIALAAPGWFYVRLGEKGEALVGLWRFCHDEPKYDCQDFDSLWTVDAWLEASRAFAIMGFLALVLCAVSTLLVCFVSHVKIFYSVAPVSSLLASLFIFIEFSVFSGEVERRKNTIGQEFEYHYCFALTVIAFILSLIATLLFLCGSLRGPPKANYEVRERQRRDSNKSKQSANYFDE